LRRFGADYDLIFIDVPRVTDSRSDSSTMMLLQNCDSVLVPVLGSEVDLLSSQTFTDAIQDTASYKQGMGEDFRVYGFINKRNQRKENEEAEKSMKKYGLEMFRQSLPDLKLFTHPSFYSSVLQYVEGERRFKPFFNEFVRKFEIRGE
jgi:cellulose biosynthesis protein BcsQ